MLRIRGESGSFELSAQEEAQLRSLTDYEFCVRLNAAPNDSLLLIAKAERPRIQYFNGYGYLPIQ